MIVDITIEYDKKQHNEGQVRVGQCTKVTLTLDIPQALCSQFQQELAVHVNSRLQALSAYDNFQIRQSSNTQAVSCASDVDAVIEWCNRWVTANSAAV